MENQTTHRGPRRYRYAGVLDRQLRGKFHGAGRGVSSDAAPSYNRTPPPPPSDRAQLKGISCFNCGKEGHESPACLIRKSTPGHLCYAPHSISPFKNQQRREPIITIKLNGKPVTALVDTRCSQTLVKADLVPLELRNCQDKLTIFCVHGDQSELSTVDVYVRSDVPA